MFHVKHDVLFIFILILPIFERFTFLTQFQNTNAELTVFLSTKSPFVRQQQSHFCIAPARETIPLAQAKFHDEPSKIIGIQPNNRTQPHRQHESQTHKRSKTTTVSTSPQLNHHTKILTLDFYCFTWNTHFYFNSIVENFYKFYCHYFDESFVQKPQNFIQTHSCQPSAFMILDHLAKTETTNLWSRSDFCIRIITTNILFCRNWIFAHGKFYQ